MKTVIDTLQSLREQAWHSPEQAASVPPHVFGGLIAQIELALCEEHAAWLKSAADANPMTIVLMKQRLLSLNEAVRHREWHIARMKDQIAKLKRNLRQAYAELERAEEPTT